MARKQLQQADDKAKKTAEADKKDKALEAKKRRQSVEISRKVNRIS